MAGKRLDYGIDRKRHQSFVGRAALLSQLDRLLLDDGPDCWVLVTGGPGMGKSALLAAWLAHREAAGVTVPHHFIRRGEYDWDDPVKLVGSLVAQIEERFPDLRESDDDEKKHPAARLAAILTRVSDRELVPERKRLVILIDGLDEYDPPAGTQVGNPLAAFLPHALPRGVSFLCASRPRYPHVKMLEAREDVLIRIDLDDPSIAADNEATVRMLWQRAAPSLGLDARFIDEAVARAGGNPQHAVTLQKHLAGLPPAQRRVEIIPRGLTALLEKSWQRIAADPVAARGLGILCVAREALSLDELAAVAGWSGDTEPAAFLRGASELLIETHRDDRECEYRLHHDAIASHIESRLTTAVRRGHHLAIAKRLATWPPPAEPLARRYALRHALTHRAQSGGWDWAWQLAADTGFWEAKCRELGVHEAEADATHTAERCRAAGVDAFTPWFNDLAYALARESHRLREAPEATAALIWNRLRRSGWTARDLDQQLRISGERRFLRVRHAATRESPALLRDLVGHDTRVTACTVTPDGRRVISASSDRTLKVWSLESGHLLTTMVGHGGGVTACAVTPDGQRVISASGDRTLKVWQIDTGQVTTTPQGHPERVTACPEALDGRRAISASADRTLSVWDLENGRILQVLEGHRDRVTACAVTPGGERVVSASWDRTLKIWDLASGRALVTLVGHADQVTACGVMPDGLRVFSASRDRTMKLWNLEDGALLATLEGHADQVTACVATHDGRQLISASYDQTLKIWDLARSRAIATFEGHTWGVTACAITPDGRRLVSASWDQTLRIWDLARDHGVPSFEGHRDGVTACAVTSDGKHAVTVSRDHTLKVWSIETGRVLATLEDHVGPVIACTVTSDRQLVLSASKDQTFEVRGLERGRILATFERHAEQVAAWAMAPDDRPVISASAEPALKVWDLDSDAPVSILVRHTEGATACTVNPDGNRVISASGYCIFQVWDLDTGEVATTFSAHIGRVTACAMTSDGERMISASEDRTLKILDLSRGHVLASLEGHAERIHACAVTPDGHHAISASEDRTLRIWDLDTGACCFVHRGDVAYTAVAATSTTIIAGDSAGTVWFLDWLTAKSAALAPPPLLPGQGPGSTGMAALPVAAATLPEPAASSPHVILFLAASPGGATPLDLDDECAAIERELSMTPARHDFDFHSKWAVSIQDMMRHLNELKPAVIHFSGHGGAEGGEPRAGPATATRREIQIEIGIGRRGAIYLEDEQRQQRHVNERGLVHMIQTAAPRARVAVLNSCYSDALAEALCRVVDCVVGMRGAIGDGAALIFAVAFYRALGHRCSVGNAVEQACATLAAMQLPDEHLPVCRTRPGVDAGRLFLPMVVGRCA